MDLHDTKPLVATFAINVILALLTYVVMVVQAVAVPFAVDKLPVEWGPGWLYSCIYLLATIEYQLWPMEISDYMFMSHQQQNILLHNQKQYKRWTTLCYTWGSIMSVMLVVSMVMPYAQPTVESYLVNWYVRTFVLGQWCLSNWMFLLYLVLVKNSGGYRTFIWTDDIRPSDIPKPIENLLVIL